MFRGCVWLAVLWSALLTVRAEDIQPLPDTAALTADGEIDALLRAGIDRFAVHLLGEAPEARGAYWKRDFLSRESYTRSVEPNRQRLREILGVVDERLPIESLELIGTTARPSLIAENDRYEIHAVRWEVLPNVFGEGLLLKPRSKPVACIVAIPDADQTPEMICGMVEGVGADQEFGRKLAEAGCLVVSLTLIDRQDTWSGSPDIWMTNQPHREWVYRPAFELGRHIIGYEIQKVLALVDWFAKEQTCPIGIAGYGEGGLIAFYAAALDTRLQAALVSGYIDSRQGLWQEPIYRNVFRLLREFGDAEIATLITPRSLIVEYCEVPQVEGPPIATGDRRPYAAPGSIATPPYDVVRDEVERARLLLGHRPGFANHIELVSGTVGSPVGPGSDHAVAALLDRLGAIPSPQKSPSPLTSHSTGVDAEARRERQLRQLVDHTQSLIPRSQKVREEFWAKAKPTSLEEWETACQEYKQYFWENIIGRLPPASLPIHPRTRQIRTGHTWTAYEVLLDVWPDVFCWGVLVVPKGIVRGERRPVVVCQHGAEGLPFDVIDEDPNSQNYATYKAYAIELAKRGFVVFAPHNFYRGGEEFRRIHRKLNPLGYTIFAVIAAQHDRHLDWLTTLPFVDPSRIGYYGLSYGGYTAERIPPLLDRYALAISSAEFNDMVRKKASVRDKYSFPFYYMYEYFEFNMANRFSYGDLVGMMAPRPFMVERGHLDGVAPDEWVAAEYAKVRRTYTFLGIPDRTEIEFFNGPHAIHGVKTFEFLHRHLDWKM